MHERISRSAMLATFVMTKFVRASNLLCCTSLNMNELKAHQNEPDIGNL